MKNFQVAGGTVPGTDHTLPGQPGWFNNQDAFSWVDTDDYLVAVVCDGCSNVGGDDDDEDNVIVSRSEIGAQLMSRFISAAIARVLENEGMQNFEQRLIEVQRDALVFIDVISSAINDLEQPNPVVVDSFLFTVVGVAMDKEKTAVFALGDGVIAVNGEVTKLGPFPNNAPPYLAYNLLKNPKSTKTYDLAVKIERPTAEVNSVFIGTDGVKDLISASLKQMPGRIELVGYLEQFWRDPKFMSNPDNIRRRLALINLERAEGGHIKSGLLPDDTTFVVVRRIVEPEVKNG